MVTSTEGEKNSAEQSALELQAEIWCFFCEQTKGCVSSGSSWFHQLLFFRRLVVPFSYRFLTVPLSAVAWEGCRGGRRQPRVASVFKSQHLAGSASNGCKCLSGGPDSVQLSEIRTHSECYMGMSESFRLFNFCCVCLVSAWWWDAVLYVSKCFLYRGLSPYNLAFSALSFVAANKIIELVLDCSWKVDVVVGTL